MVTLFYVNWHKTFFEKKFLRVYEYVILGQEILETELIWKSLFIAERFQLV